MKLTVERLPESRAVLEIAADEDEFATAMDKAYRRVANQVVLPGFRKGKAPRALIERAYGREIFLEEANKLLMDDLYRRALTEADLAPVGEPEVEVTTLEPLAFKVTIPVYPTVDPGDFAAVRVEPVDAALDEAEVEAELERLRKANSPWVDPQDEGLEVGPDLVLRPKTRYPRPGDQVTIDYSVVEEGAAEAETEEDAEFVLGESGLLARLEEEIQRLRVGETATFTETFADDDEVVDPGLRGKTMRYTVTLKGLKERDLVPLDDDFARSVSEAETLAELRDTIREALHRDKTAQARAEVVSAIIDRMVEGATFDLPAVMIDETVESDVDAMRRRLVQRGLSLEAYLRLTNQDLDALKQDLRPEAERKLRRVLLLREVAKREGIAVEETDLDASVERMAATAATARDPKQAEAFFRSDYVRDTLRDELFDRKLQDRLIELATEGRGAVLNGWEPPAVPELGAEGEVAAGGAATTEGAAAGAPSEESTPANWTPAGGEREGDPVPASEEATATAAAGSTG